MGLTFKIPPTKPSVAKTPPKKPVEWPEPVPPLQSKVDVWPITGDGERRVDQICTKLGFKWAVMTTTLCTGSVRTTKKVILVGNLFDGEGEDGEASYQAVADRLVEVYGDGEEG